MSVAFPTLSVYPNDDSFVETLAFDPSLRSQAEDGTVISRAKFTGVKKKFIVSYTYLPVADKVLLEALQLAVLVGADTIVWTHPITDVVYTVRLAEPIEFSIKPQQATIWQAVFTLIEA